MDYSDLFYFRLTVDIGNVWSMLIVVVHMRFEVQTYNFATSTFANRLGVEQLIPKLTSIIGRYDFLSFLVLLSHLPCSILYLEV